MRVCDDAARFLAPFTLTADSRYLHTNLEPCAHAPNRYEFRITSRPHTSLDTASTVHCVGTLERLPNTNALQRRVPASTPRAIPVDTLVMGDLGNFSECMYADGESFYANMQARIGEAFSYGPYFRTIKCVHRDIETLRLRVEIEQDPTLWQAWDQMGYMMHPTVLDGVLQIFIVFVMEASDFTGVPQVKAAAVSPLPSRCLLTAAPSRHPNAADDQRPGLRAKAHLREAALRLRASRLPQRAVRPARPARLRARRATRRCHPNL